MNEKVIGLIPARMGSSRFPGKPIVNIDSYPMIYWVYDKAKKSELIDEIYVVTPDIEISNVCKDYDIPCLYDPKQGNTAAQKLAFAVEKLDGDIYLNIQGDEPLLDYRALEQIVLEMKNDSNLYYVGLKSKIKTEEDFKNRNIVKTVVDKDNYALYFSRQPIPSKFEDGNSFRVLGLYGYRDWFLKLFATIDKSSLENLESGVEMLRMMQEGYKIKLLDTDYSTIGVDVEDDVKKVEKIMKKVR